MTELILTAVPTIEHPDAQLVAAARRGEQVARRALYLRYASGLGGMAVRLLGSRADGEDALHDAFADAFQRLDQLRDPAAFGGWLRRIVLTRVHRQLRRRRLRGLLGLSHHRDATLAQLAGGGCAPDRVAELARLDAALDRLSSSVRVCWILRRVEGLTIPEVADATGLSPATVKRRLTVARTAIEAHVADRRGAP